MADIKKLKGKDALVDCMKCTVDFNVNNRFHGSGQVLYGVSVPDTRDIPGMKAMILEVGRVVERVTLSERPDKSLIVLRGNRRIAGAQDAMADPETPAEVKAELRKIPALIYTGLSREEELELINDQDVKRYLKSELLNQIWKQQLEGYGWGRLAVKFQEQLAVWSGNTRALAEAKAITNEADRNLRIRTMLRNTLEKEIMTIPTLGERVQKNYFLQILNEDGILKDTDPKPEYVIKKVETINELVKKQKEDGDKWTATHGGPAFNAFLEDFIAKQKAGITTRQASGRMSVKDLEMRIKTCQSEVSAAALQMALGKPQEKFPHLDHIAGLWTRKTEMVLASLEDYPPEVQAVLKPIFTIDTMTDFNLFMKTLENGIPKPVIAEPQIEQTEEVVEEVVTQS